MDFIVFSVIAKGLQINTYNFEEKILNFFAK